MTEQPTEIKSFIEHEKAVLLYFKNENCMPCQTIRPKVKDLIEHQFPLIKMEVVNIRSNPLLVSEFNVFSAPTILLFIEGKEYIRKGAYVSMDELKEEIGRLYHMAFNE